jgi:hypothetical protein
MASRSRCSVSHASTTSLAPPEPKTHRQKPRSATPAINNGTSFRLGPEARIIPACDRSQPVTGGRKRSPVEVLHAYANPTPQLDAALDRLTEPAEPETSDAGPSWEPRPDCNPVPDDASPMLPRPLDRRLSAEQRKAIVVAYGAGARQKALAVQYGISDRSVKRLIAKARKTGTVLRTRGVRSAR